MARVRLGPPAGMLCELRRSGRATGLDNELEKGRELGDLVQAALAQGLPDAVVVGSGLGSRATLKVTHAVKRV